MASHTLALTLLVCLNLVLFTLVSSNYVPCPPPPPPPCPPPSGGHGGHHGGGPVGPGIPTPPSPKSPGGPIIPTPPSPKTPGGHIIPTPPAPKSPGGPIISTPPGAPGFPAPATPPPSKGGKCPTNILKLKVCGNVLNGLINVVLGVPPKSECCPLLQGLTDLDAALCLCTAIEANVLGINLDVPVSLSLLLNYCGKTGVPSGFQCPTPGTPTPSPTTPKTPATPSPTTPKTPATPTLPTPTTPTPTPTPSTPATPTPTPSTPTTPAPSMGRQCPTDILKLKVCGNVLNGLINVVLGAPPKSECCPLLQGLTDLDAALCLCTAIEANVLGINLDVPVSLSLLLNYCGKTGVPSGFQCPSPTPSPSTPTPLPTTPATPTPATPTPSPTTPATPTPTPTPATPTPSPTTPATPTPTPSTPAPSMGGKCPTNILKLNVCGNVLNGLINVVLGAPPKSECCPLLQGLTDLDAALCLCTAIEANVLGINLDVPVSLSLLLNYCGKTGVPSGFQCPTTPTTPMPSPATPAIPTPLPTTPATPTPATPTPLPTTPTTPTPATPTPSPTTPTPSPTTPTPSTPTTPAPSMGGQCPTDILKLNVCGNVLNGLINVVLGGPPKSECCPLLQGLTDLDAALCLCTAIEANVLGINLDVPVSLSLLLNYCGKTGVPSGFQCPT